MTLRFGEPGKWSAFSPCHRLASLPGPAWNHKRRITALYLIILNTFLINFYLAKNWCDINKQMQPQMTKLFLGPTLMIRRVLGFLVRLNFLGQLNSFDVDVGKSMSLFAAEMPSEMLPETQKAKNLNAWPRANRLTGLWGYKPYKSESFLEFLEAQIFAGGMLRQFLFVPQTNRVDSSF